MGIFEEKNKHRTSDFKQILKKAGAPLGSERTEKLAGMFGNRYGGEIDEKDVKTVLRELKEIKNQPSADSQIRKEAEKDFNDLTKITGVKI